MTKEEQILDLEMELGDIQKEIETVEDIEYGLVDTKNFLRNLQNRKLEEIEHLESQLYE
jgi:hypothetical protein|tara:strand:+ start:2097 stop:2273 length:177 start_codon:yes stop_codon:yes gene_type:complete